MKAVQSAGPPLLRHEHSKRVVAAVTFLKSATLRGVSAFPAEMAKLGSPARCDQAPLTSLQPSNRVSRHVTSNRARRRSRRPARRKA